MGGRTYPTVGEGCGHSSSQGGVPFEQRDVGLNHPIPESGLQVAQFPWRSIWASNRQRLIGAQLGGGDGEVTGQRLADDQAGAAQLPVRAKDRPQLLNNCAPATAT